LGYDVTQFGRQVSTFHSHDRENLKYRMKCFAKYFHSSRQLFHISLI